MIKTSAISETIRTALYENVTLLDPDTEIQYPNIPFNQPANSSYASLHIEYDNRDRIEIGNRFFEYNGRLMVRVYTPSDVSIPSHEDIIDDIRTIFDDVYINGIWFKTSDVRTAGNTSDFYRSDVISEFTAYED